MYSFKSPFKIPKIYLALLPYIPSIFPLPILKLTSLSKSLYFIFKRISSSKEYVTLKSSSLYLLSDFFGLINSIFIKDVKLGYLIDLSSKVKISFIKDPIYYYMVRSDSIISQIKKEQIESTENAMVNVKKIYEKNNK